MTLHNSLSDTTALRSRRFLFWLDWIIPFLLLAAVIYIFRKSNLDLTLQKLFYRAGSGWFLKDTPFFSFIYRFSNIPALLLAITGLVLFWLSWQTNKWAKWRKVGLFLVLAMLLGPGLIINTGLKNNWGRPRPRETTDFGGKYAYEQLLTIDASSPGFSFPCGHASMGFYLFTPWFILRKKRPGLALAVLGTGLVAGLLIGLARMAQGAHYGSDVLVAGSLVYLVGAALFYLLKLNRATWYYPKKEDINRSQRTIITAIVSVLLVFLLLGVILATPYVKQKAYSAQNLSDALPIVMQIDLPQADLNLYPADSLGLKFETQGFGFPRSKLVSTWRDSTGQDTIRVSFSQVSKGWFTELNNKVRVAYPFRSGNRLAINLAKGSATIVLPDSLGSFNLDIRMQNGTLDLDLPAKMKPRISLKGDFALSDSTGFNSQDGIYVNPDFRVHIVVVKGNLILR